jgi:hypothetical protein
MQLRVRAKLFVAVLVAVVALFVTAGSAGAAMPLTQTQPFQAVCEAQGGVFQVATDFRDLYCVKTGGLFTAFTEQQLHVQRVVCENVYAAFFGFQGESPNSTRTFCSVAT